MSIISITDFYMPQAFPVPQIPQTLITAYLQTEYHVLGESPFILKVGIASKPLIKLYKQTQTDCGVFITAWNPHSRNIEASVNHEKQAELAKELSQHGLIYIDGVGRHPQGGWPEEPSFFVPGLSLEAGKTLGGKYQQNAVIWCGPNSIPELVLLRK
ncbi:MAG: DUF3293 domain-containing protein [Gallionella sp.]